MQPAVSGTPPDAVRGLRCVGGEKERVARVKMRFLGAACAAGGAPPLVTAPGVSISLFSLHGGRWRVELDKHVHSTPVTFCALVQ